jgi:transcriptional regulator of acetoin/glycerol metabolism
MMKQDKTTKQATTIQLKATDAVYKLREDKTRNDNELAEMLGISKVTLYTRLKVSNWKKSELALINTLK